MVAALLVPLAGGLLWPHVHATSAVASASEACAVCAVGATVADRAPDAVALARPVCIADALPPVAPEEPRAPARSAHPSRGPPSPLV